MRAWNLDGDFIIAFALLSFNSYPSILPTSYPLLPNSFPNLLNIKGLKEEKEYKEGFMLITHKI